MMTPRSKVDESDPSFASEPKKEWSVDGDYRNEIQTRRSEGFKVDTTSCVELFFSRQCPRDQVCVSCSPIPIPYALPLFFLHCDLVEMLVILYEDCI
jgi:hypothetical protein